MRRGLHLAAVAAAAVTMSAAVTNRTATTREHSQTAAHRQEACAWAPGFHSFDFDDWAGPMVVYDDGNGPALYVGGAFDSAGEVAGFGLARWDGTSWSALEGPNGAGTNGEVYALAVFDDGSGPALYAGGSFTPMGGLTVNNVAKWQGAAWSALVGPSATGVDGPIYALAVFDDGSGNRLYAGGGFHSAGGIAANHIASWDGSSWSALAGPTGTDHQVEALAVFDDGGGPALYVGGRFTWAGGVLVNGIARWNGASWAALVGPAGPGMGGTYPYVYELVVYDDGSGPSLFAGGRFSTAGGVTVNSMAKWDGSVWSALIGPSGTGTDGEVRALAVHDDGSGPSLFAGGGFSTAGGVTVNSIARWDGSTWSALSGPSGTGTDGSVGGLAVFDDGSGEALYAAGDFLSAGGLAVRRISRWRDTGWSGPLSSIGAGIDSVTHAALAAFDDGSGNALYVGGDLATAGGSTVNYIARWDGSVWSALSGPWATGTNAWVAALAVYDDGTGPALYAGGGFTIAGGVTVNRIAKWDGSAWSGLSGPSATGTNNVVYALAAYDDGAGPALYAGGYFTTAGGLTVNRIARWDGSAWSPLGDGLGGHLNEVLALAVYDDGSSAALYAGGDFFETTGGLTVNHIAKWDGSDWSALSGPWETGTSGMVEALAVFDDGTGPALYAGGSFTTAGGVTVNNVARWNGSAWSSLTGPSGTGTSGRVYALQAFDDGVVPALYVGGFFTNAGGLLCNHIARWDGIAWSQFDGGWRFGVNHSVRALGQCDDGTGNALFAVGEFTASGDAALHHIGQWRCPLNALIFADGFESGDTSQWSVTVP